MEPDDSQKFEQPQKGGPAQCSADVEAGALIHIPDHEMLRCIGKGSYGQVWLARNMMGAYRAVKLIFRNSFKDKRPFDREISGIRRFEPISRQRNRQSAGASAWPFDSRTCW